MKFANLCKCHLFFNNSLTVTFGYVSRTSSYVYILADDCDVLVHGQEPSNCWESLFNMMITINQTKVAGGTAVVLIYITPISLHISAYRYSEKTIKKMGDNIFVRVGWGGAFGL